MQPGDSNQDPPSGDVDEQPHVELSRRFAGRLRVIAKQSVKYWFDRDRLDKLLAQYINSLEGCELIYAIDQSGRQISSNVFPTSIDASYCGQDLSRRPYAISLAALSDLARHEVFTCNSHVSQATNEPCETVLYGVTSDASLMGFIAADFNPAWEALGDGER
tara:strand:- start:2088 stop:2573 length:486 start_codon:yes stop_codon:yes gene_type:complete